APGRSGGATRCRDGGRAELGRERAPPARTGPRRRRPITAAGRLAFAGVQGQAPGPSGGEPRGGRRMARTFTSLLSAEVVTRAFSAVAAIIVVRAVAPGAFG